MSLEARILGLEGGGTKEKKEEEKEEEEEEEKFPLCESIGHRPLRGRCPKSEFFRHFGYSDQIIWALPR